MSDNVKTGVYVQNEDEFKVDIKTTISASDKALFVKIATSLLFDEDENYYSILKDMAFDFALVATFTNIHTDYILESDDVYKEIEDLLEDTNIADIIIANAGVELINDLKKSVDENIEYRTGIHKNMVMDGLGKLLDTLDNKISNFNFELNDNDAANILETLTNVSSSVNMDNIIEAFSKTDMYKKKWEQIAAEKESEELQNGSKTPILSPIV